MNQANRKLNVKVEWEKGEEAMREARVLLNQKLAGGAISRSYYAAFHAAQALLLTKGLEAKSHQGVGRLLSLHFVKTGELEAKVSRILSKAQKFREEADYSSEYCFTMDDAKERLGEVEIFILIAERYLKENGF